MPVEIRNMRLWLGQNYPLWLVQWLRTRRSPLRSDFVINVGMWDRHVVTRSDRLILLKYSGFLPGQIDFAQVLWFPHRTGWFRSSTLVSSLDRLISLKYSGFLPGQVDFAQVLWFPHRLISGFLQLKDQINISTDDSDFYSLYNLFRYRCKLNKV